MSGNAFLCSMHYPTTQIYKTYKRQRISDSDVTFGGIRNNGTQNQKELNKNAYYEDNNLVKTIEINRTKECNIHKADKSNM